MPHASIDGESHGTLTLIVCVTGIIVAVILIIIIIRTMECGKVERFILQPEELRCANQGTNLAAATALPPLAKAKKIAQKLSEKSPKENQHKQKRNLFAIFGYNRDSFDVEKASNSSNLNGIHRENSVSTILTDISWNTTADGTDHLSDSRETVFTIEIPTNV